MNDKEPITKTVLDGLITSFTELNLHWLLTGVGEMFLEKKKPEPGMLTGVMEPAPPVYVKGVRSSLRVEELPEILLGLQAEVEELRRRVEALEGKGKVGDEG